jgi:hypothetical protein
LKRYKIYVSHVQEWRQQFQKLESVNLRYDNQVIVNPDMEGRPKQATLTASAARAAVAAGVKPAALITKIGPHDRPLPKPAFELTEKKLDPKAAAKKPAPKARIKKTAAKTAKAAPKKPAAQPAGKKPVTIAAHVPPPPQRPVSAMPKPSPAIAKPSANTSSN